MKKLTNLTLLTLFLFSLSSAQESRTSYRFRRVPVPLTICQPADVFYAISTKVFGFCTDVNTVGTLSTGSGASGRITFWNGTNSLSSNSTFTFDGTNLSIPSGGQYRINGSAFNFTNLAGNIAVSQMNSGTGASSSTYWRGDGTWAALTSVTANSTAGNIPYLSASNTYSDSPLTRTSSTQLTSTANFLAPDGTVSLPSFSFASDSTTGIYKGSSQIRFSITGTTRAFIGAAGLVSDNLYLDTTNADVVLSRDAANTLALRNGVNAQTFRIYNTYTDTSNYERLRIAWVSNILELGTDGAGTGTATRSIRIRAGTTAQPSILFGASNIQLRNGSDSTFLQINASDVTLSANTIFGTDNTYDIGASGANRPRNIYAANEIRGSSFYLVGGGGLGAVFSTSGSTDGIITLKDFAGTSFSRLQFGGTTSSFPAIKRNGTGIDLRLADDSGYAALAIDANLGLSLGGIARISSQASSNIRLTDSSATTFGLLQLGGTSNSFPAIKRNATALNFRLADDSADAPITASTAGFSGDTTTSSSQPNQNIVWTNTANYGAIVFKENATTKSSIQQIGSTFATTARRNYLELQGASGISLWTSGVQSFTVDTSGHIFAPNLTTSAGFQSGYICGGASGELVSDSGLCLASSGRFKYQIHPLDSIGLNELMKFNPVRYYYKPEFNGKLQSNINFNREFVGLIAEDVNKIDSRFVTYENDNVTPHSVRYEQLVALVIKAVQEEQFEINDLKSQVSELRQEVEFLKKRIR